MTQKATAEKLIGLTLYKKQPWHPVGILINDTLQLIHANTVHDTILISIDYRTDRITVNSKQLRIPKELKHDLLSIVKLKVAKTLKHAKLN